MALWLVRAGRHGEHEKKFLDDGRIYLTWDRLEIDLGSLESKDALRTQMGSIYEEFSKGKLSHHTGQIWTFYKRMSPGDWVILPSKTEPSIHVAEIVSEYRFDVQGSWLYKHFREVRWIEQSVPRSSFDQDLLYSFGAFMTICQVARNDAEQRVRAMAKNGWKVPNVVPILPPGDEDDTPDADAVDLEQLARDQLAKHVLAKFKGHGLARLVAAILEAQGYTIHLSPEGPDGGVDILAAPGPLGFGKPRLCVQVKSEQSPIERTVMDQLIGAMQTFQADQGLLVSWGGFKKSFESETPRQFFRVRLWNQGDIIEQLITHYDLLNEDIRTEIPIKHVWVLARTDEDSE